MLTVSLHGIRIHANHGLYPQGHLLGNVFEVDVDVFLPATSNRSLPFVDYVMLHGIVSEIFIRQGELLETFVQEIHGAIKQNVPEAEKVKVVVRKMNPPMQGHVRYAQVQFEG